MRAICICGKHILGTPKGGVVSVSHRAWYHTGYLLILDGILTSRLPNIRDRSGEIFVDKWVASHLSRQKICYNADIDPNMSGQSVSFLTNTCLERECIVVNGNTNCILKSKAVSACLKHDQELKSWWKDRAFSYPSSKNAVRCGGQPRLCGHGRGLSSASNCLVERYFVI